MEDCFVNLGATWLRLIGEVAIRKLLRQVDLNLEVAELNVVF
jgi:hypothetical protein